MADSITEDVIKKALAAKLGRKEDGIVIVSMEMSGKEFVQIIRETVAIMIFFL